MCSKKLERETTPEIKIDFELHNPTIFFMFTTTPPGHILTNYDNNWTKN